MTAFGFVGLYTNIESVISHLPTFFTEGFITKEVIDDDMVAPVDHIVAPVPPESTVSNVLLFHCLLRHSEIHSSVGVKSKSNGICSVSG